MYIMTLLYDYYGPLTGCIFIIGVSMILRWLLFFLFLYIHFPGPEDRLIS